MVVKPKYKLNFFMVKILVKNTKFNLVVIRTKIYAFYRFLSFLQAVFIEIIKKIILCENR